MIQQPPFRDPEALCGRGWGEQLVGACLCVMVRPLSLDHCAEEDRVDVGDEMDDLTAEIHNDGQRHATEDGRVFLHFSQCGHGLRDGVTVAFHQPESPA